jgi:hypothetical protein
MAGTQRRAPVPPFPPPDAPAGVSKNVLNSRFISCWIVLSSRTGSQRTSAMR